MSARRWYHPIIILGRLGSESAFYDLLGTYVHGRLQYAY